MVDASLRTNWPRRSAWAGVMTESAVEATRPVGVHVTPREGLGIASILARRGGEAVLSMTVTNDGADGDHALFALLQACVPSSQCVHVQRCAFADWPRT